MMYKTVRGVSALMQTVLEETCTNEEAQTVVIREWENEKAAMCPLYTTLTMPPPPPGYMVRRHTKKNLDTAIDRTVGTVGFLGGLVMYFGFCCCVCSPRDGVVQETYNGHTLCGLFCPLP